MLERIFNYLLEFFTLYKAYRVYYRCVCDTGFPYPHKICPRCGLENRGIEWVGRPLHFLGGPTPYKWEWMGFHDLPLELQKIAKAKNSSLVPIASSKEEDNNE